MEMFEPDKFYSPSQVAEISGRRYMTIWGWIHKNRITARKLEGRWEIKGSDLNSKIKVSREVAKS
jgi:hypothetical protein